jgi:streptogramin lyase
MFTARMLVLDPATGGIEDVPTPAPQPRAVEIDRDGRWWVLLGGPRVIARYDPRTRAWSSWPIGMYPHSIGLLDGVAWFNGHFTHLPELIGHVDSSGTVRVDTVPPHPDLAPVPYELRVGPDGRIWMSELLGNRILSYTPGPRRFEEFILPAPFSGPRRFDVDAAGILWIPAYAAGSLVRLDPNTGRFDEYPLPERNALPYVVRVDGANGRIWIGTGADDAVWRFDQQRRRFTRYALPSRGALVRHMAIDPRTHDVWLAYGASPGRISARIARLRARD